MAIAPLQLPSSQPFTQQIDFATPLARIGQSIDTAQQRQSLADLGKGIMDGSVNIHQAAGQALAAGNSQLGLSLLKLEQLGAQSANGVYGTPIYGTDANGKTVLGAITKNGQFRQLDTGGVTPTPGVRFLDTGTGFIGMNSRTGQPMGPISGGQGGVTGASSPAAGALAASPVPASPAAPAAPFRQDPLSIGNVIGGGTANPGAPQGNFIPKDIRGAEAAKAEGKAQGTAVAEYQSIKSKMPGLEQVVKKLDGLADKATYTLAGQGLDNSMRQLGMQPRDAAIARAQYTATVDNQILPLLRDTFGAQFTEREGNVLRATLGDPNKSPKEKQALLRAFIDQKNRDVEALRVRTGQPATQRPAQSSAPPMQGARQAPDGNWYVQQNGRYFRVEQ